jgi:hypothetical protein
LLHAAASNTVLKANLRKFLVRMESFLARRLHCRGKRTALVGAAVDRLAEPLYPAVCGQIG